MYSMKNGILYENGRPVFCVGLSYYPSYHERKVPVPEDGDRVGEMKKDLRRMKEAGFNLVRAASIGDVKRVNGELEIHTEFIERLLDEADQVDIASMMRLQGYSMNLSGYDDFYMINSKGEEMDKTRWYDFLQNSMYHPGILRDNDDGTRALAALYAVIAVVRSVLEPKIVAAQVGLPPLVALAAMYVGFCVVGVAGMILLPLAVLVVKQLHDGGFVGLWR